MTRLAIFALITLSAMAPISAQTCSCGGAPLLGFLNRGIVAAGNWQVALNYEYDDLSNLVSGSKSLGTDGRTYINQSNFLSLSYGISARLAITAIITSVSKLRKITDQIAVSGLGDAIIFAQFNLLPKYSYPKRELQLGLGVKIPVGASDLKQNGLLISADLQPTSGAYDAFFTAFASAEILPPAPLTVSALLSYRNTGTSQRFDFSNDGYRFGSEALMTFALTYRPAINTGLNLLLSYQNSQPDQYAGFEQPNTGGEWYYSGLGATHQLGQHWAVSLNGRWPVYQKVRGAAQFSSRVNLGLGLVYTFGNSDNKNNYGKD